MFRSVTALTLGIFPFIIHTVTRNIFKAFAYLGATADARGYTILRKMCGVLGVPAAVFMVGSAKLFALTQLLVWKHYVRKPEDDGANTRLAWYGAGYLPWNDLQAITGAFFNQQLASNVWTLKQWKKVQL